MESFFFNNPLSEYRAFFRYDGTDGPVVEKCRNGIGCTWEDDP
jgi:hypothetical protein